MLTVLFLSCLSGGTNYAKNDKVKHKDDAASAVDSDKAASSPSAARLNLYQPQKVSNAPGYIVTDPKSGYFQGVTYSSRDSKDGVDIRTPPKLLYRNSKGLPPALIGADGRLSRPAVTIRKQRLVVSDMNLFVQECGDRDAKIVRTFPEREKETFCRDAYLTYVQQTAPEWFALLPDQYKHFQNQTAYLPQLKSIKRLEKNNDRTHLAIDYAMKKFDEALQLGSQLKDAQLSKEDVVNSARVRPLLESLFQAMEVAEGIGGKRIDDTSMKVYIHNSKNLFRTLTVDNSRPQAVDLVRSQDGDYINPNSLTGKDTSILNPRSDAIWKLPSRPISKFNTRNYDAEHTKAGPEDLWKRQDDNPIFVFDDISHGRGHNAKFHVKRYAPIAGGKLQEEKFKLKFETPYERPRQQNGIPEAIGVFDGHGQESMTPVAASNLAAALGFAVEPVFFKKKVRVLFPPEEDDKALDLTPQYCASYNQFFDKKLDEAVETLNTRFGRNPSTGRDVVKYSYLKTLKKQDASGCYVLEIPAVNLTPSIGAELKTSTFIKEAYGRQFKRTYRAIQIFYALIYDIDSTDFNATVNVIDGKVIHKAADMGSAFGWMMARDSVNDFSSHFVKSVEYRDSAKRIPSRVVFTYRSIELNRISRMVTLDDAKWFARLAGQLTGEQIRQAFLAAGYDEDIADEYAYKMVRRINGMISALGIEGTQIPDAEGKPVTISLLKEPGAPSNGHFVIKGFEKCFDTKKNRFTCIPEELRNNDPPGEVSPEARQIEGKSVLFDDLSSVAKNSAAEVLGDQLRDQMNLIQLNNSHLLIAHDDIHAGSLIGVRPIHFTIPNPFADPEAPMWSVDMFSLRIGVQGLSQMERNIIGLKTTTLGLGAFIGRSVIHIHPTQNALREQLEFYKVFLHTYDMNPIHPLLRKSLDMMVPGDIVVMVDQYGVAGSTPSGFSSLVGLAGNAGFRWTKLRQFVAIKPNKDAMAASWLNGDVLELISNGGQLPIIAPLISALHNRLNTTENNFYFDNWAASSEGFKDEAVARFEKSEPPATDDPVFGKYRYQKRDLRRWVQSWAWNILGLKGKQSSHEKVISTIYNPEGKKDVVDSRVLSSIRLKRKRRDISLRPLTEDLFRVQSAVLDNGAPILRINSDYARLMGTSKDFESLRKRHLRLLPGGWIEFDPMAKKERFAELEFHAEFLVTEEGFRNIVEKAQQADKKALYQGLLEFISTDDLARYKASGDSADRFAKRMEKVVLAYSGFLKDKSESNIETLNDAVTNLINIKQFTYAGLKYLLSIAGEDNYTVSARLYKDPGFPNGDSYLVLPEKYSGRLAQTAEGKARIAWMMDVFHYTLTSFDVVMASIYPYLVDYLPSRNFSAAEDANRYNVPREFPIITPPKSPQTGLTKPAVNSSGKPENASKP